MYLCNLVFTAENWLTEMLNPINIFSSRKGKAAECFNFCRGLKFKSKKGRNISPASITLSTE
jgi:hypothetical protein